MRNYYLAVFFLFFLVSACSSRAEPGLMAEDADPQNLPNLLGTYVVNGIDPLGGEYSGHLTISAGKASDTYHLQWIIVGAIQEGSGIIKDNQLHVEWQTIDGITKIKGTAIYSITELGQLYGIRTSENLDGEGEEQAYPNQ
jgi:hypothetical protein